MTRDRRSGGDAPAGTPRRRLLAAAASLTPVLAAGAVAAAAGAARAEPAAPAAPAAPQPSRPLPTTDADWQGVADALGRAGRVMAGTVYRVGFPRRDLHVVSQGITIQPGLALSSYAAFTRYDDGQTVVRGDLVVIEAELQRATDTLHAQGFEQTAIHKHLLAHEPDVWWTHFHGMGPDPVELARALKAALDTTGTPAAVAAPATPAPLDLETAAMDAALGTTGTHDGGIHKYSFARRETVTDDNRILPWATGVTTVLAFQPLGGGRAAVNGDFVMTAHEVQHVLTALRAGGLSVIELHNHGLMDEPRLFYTHFWGVGDGVALARALRTAVDATDTAPPG
ncbi:DUF1259 domain-containing protein [Streptomyces sp. NPDC046866]|uniref:DUF1259 domain-containing protein n=1 Tax=Streptomyces sp. NPDC046866 TaxID=3154921 RepID=UPI003453BB93